MNRCDGHSDQKGSLNFRAIVSLLISVLMLELLVPNVHAAPPITAMAVTPDGTQLLVGSQSGIELHSLPDLASVGRIKSELQHVHDLQFSPDGTRLLVCGGSPAEEGAVEVLQWPDQNRLRSVALHSDVVYRTGWSPDGMRFVSASGDGICQIVDATSGQRIASYSGHSRAVLAATFLPDGIAVASAGVDQTIRLWNSANGDHIRTLDNHVGTVNAIAVGPLVDGMKPGVATMLASISEDRTVRLWQPEIGRMTRFAKLSSIPRSMVWTADGKQLIVGCNDGKIRSVDVVTVGVLNEQDSKVGRIHETVTFSLSQWVCVGGKLGLKKLQR
jgi:WD40 repeat protein